MFIERADYEFLLLVAKLCSKIDAYISLLNLDETEVERIKNENSFWRFVFTNRNRPFSFPETFTHSKLQNLRIDFSHLAQSCKNSKNYTVAIGMDLGVEVPVYAFQAN